MLNVNYKSSISTKGKRRSWEVSLKGDPEMIIATTLLMVDVGIPGRETSGKGY